MANETTSTSLATLLPEIVAEAMFVASERSIMRGLVKNYNIPAGQGKTVTVPRYPTETAALVNEGAEVPISEVATTGVTLSVLTFGVRTLLTDLARTTASSNVVADIGRLFGEAIARKMDQDLLALFAGFTTSVGAANANMTAAKMAQAIAKLRAASVPADMLACVVHPFIAYDMKKDLTASFANPNPGIVQNEAMATGYVGSLFGVPVFESANIVDAGADAGNDYVGAVFHRDALGLAMVGDMMIETQRRASFLGDDIVASVHYGVGELYDGYGCKLVANSSI
jgi:N4-gp56 family major capsid protein